MTREDRWHVEILPSARKQLLYLRASIQYRLRVAIRALADDPFPADSIAMRGKGTGLRRLRVGNYRIIYRVQAERVRILVIRIGHRGEIYSGFEG